MAAAAPQFGGGFNNGFGGGFRPGVVGLRPVGGFGGLGGLGGFGGFGKYKLNYCIIIFLYIIVLNDFNFDIFVGIIVSFAKQGGSGTGAGAGTASANLFGSNAAGVCDIQLFFHSNIRNT